MRLKLTTPRSRVTCSSDWAGVAPRRICFLSLLQKSLSGNTPLLGHLHIVKMSLELCATCHRSNHHPSSLVRPPSGRVALWVWEKELLTASQGGEKPLGQANGSPPFSQSGNIGCYASIQGTYCQVLCSLGKGRHKVLLWIRSPGGQAPGPAGHEVLWCHHSEACHFTWSWYSEGRCKPWAGPSARVVSGCLVVSRGAERVWEKEVWKVCHVILWKCDLLLLLIFLFYSYIKY